MKGQHLHWSSVAGQEKLRIIDKESVYSMKYRAYLVVTFSDTRCERATKRKMLSEIICLISLELVSLLLPSVGWNRKLGIVNRGFETVWEEMVYKICSRCYVFHHAFLAELPITLKLSPCRAVHVCINKVSLVLR